MDAIGSSILEPFLRTIFIFGVVLIIARILGRKHISQLTFFDYLAGAAVGSLAASAMANKAIPLTTDIVCFLTWTLLIIMMNMTALHSAPARKLLGQEPKLVIRDGKILEDSLGRGFYTVNNLLTQLREKEIFDPNEVSVGILESNGDLSILKKAEYRNITAKDLNITSKRNDAARYVGKELIIDGKIITDNLPLTGKTKEWLNQELQTQGITDIHQVTLAMVTPEGKLYVDTDLDNLKI